ncbi:MAG: PAS domain-containing protein [Methylococcales bacterium]|nr:PAS domain-containing protein [Methylococcales bacterium]
MLKDMNVDDIVGDYKETTLELYKLHPRKIFYTDIESPFPEGKLIVSTTDTQGVITHANAVFVEMSGYTQEELIGHDHSILRHPDMPAIAFKDLWDTVNKGKKWEGVVKNLRKDGGYYWVKATVIPNIRSDEIVSYTSVRRKPSFSVVDASIKLYKTLT